MQAFNSDISDILKQLHTNKITGLSSQQVSDFQKSYGLNTLPKPERETTFIIFLRQFQSSLIYILLVAAAIIFFIGHHLDAFIISGILLFNAIIGTIQEGRARSIIDTLKKYITSEAIVIRNSKTEVIPASQVTLGDIIVLKEGEKVPADARLLEVYNLKVDEALLTGESQAVTKTTEKLPSNAHLADQINMVFRGTYVLSGTARAVVTAIGVETEIGKIGTTAETIEEELPLKKKLDKLSDQLLIVVFALLVLLLILGLITGKTFKELLVFLSALFICIIPEGLPVVLTLALVSGAQAMAKNKVLVKRLQAVEGLGMTDTIIIDKTGTLTRNELMVSTIFADNQCYSVTGKGYFAEGALYKDGHLTDPKSIKAISALATASQLLNDAQINYLERLKLFQISGDPTDAALQVFANKLHFSKDSLSNYSLFYELPFDAQNRYKISFFEYDNRVVSFISGAPEIILQASDAQPYDYKALHDLLKKGLRVIAMAQKEFPKNSIKKDQDPSYYQRLVENDLTFLGLFGIQDGIREEVETIIDRARQTGLHIIMATGDHKQTAQYVAEHVGIYKSGDVLIEGQELAQLTDQELKKQLSQTTVFARVSPEQKVRIVQAYQSQGDIVAMTGDGVNDVPSIVAANLGIAMGSIGTEVAKSVADLVLLDDSFSSIMAAIKEGRHIFFTLRRVILYFFSTNLSEILIVLFALLVGFPLPLYPAQILWLNFITDGFLDVSLVAEPHEKDLLLRKIDSSEHLINKRVIFKIFMMAVPMAVGSLFVFWWYYSDIKLARTMTLLTMALYQWFNVFNCRSEDKSLFEIGFFSNKWLVAATTFVFALQIFVIYNPILQKIFRTVPLDPYHWLIALGLSSSILIASEVHLLLKRKNLINRPI